MATVNDILSQAKSWYGYKESNGSHKQIVDVYNSHKPLARGYEVKYTDDWCAVFVSAVAIKCNATDIIPTECGCERMIDLFKKAGTWIEDGKIVPKPGDIIFYDWQAKDSWSDHVGIVESVTGSVITVIEGNKGDAVARRQIIVGSSTIRGYGRPKYSKPINKDNEIIKLGQRHSINFTGHDIAVDGIRGRDTMRQARKVVQFAMNLDYRCGLVVDGYFEDESQAAFENHYVKYKETQYMVTALEILLMLKGYDPKGVECPGIFGKGLEACVKQYQNDHGLENDGIAGRRTFFSLMDI